MAKAYYYALFQAVDTLNMHLTYVHHTKLIEKLNKLLRDNPTVQKPLVYNFNSLQHTRYIETLPESLQHKLTTIVSALKQISTDTYAIKNYLITHADLKDSVIIKSSKQITKHRPYLPNKVLDSLYESIGGFDPKSILGLYIRDLKELNEAKDFPNDELGEIISFYFAINLEDFLNKPKSK